MTSSSFDDTMGERNHFTGQQITSSDRSSYKIWHSCRENSFAFKSQFIRSEIVFQLCDICSFNQHLWMHLKLNTFCTLKGVLLHFVMSRDKMIFADVTFNACTGYEVSIFSRSKYMKGSQNLKMGHVTQATPFYGSIFSTGDMLI